MTSAHLNVRLCCAGCLTARVFCPFCGSEIHSTLPGPPEAFPCELTPARPCPGCHASISATAIGWALNPTGERPAAEVLSDRLPALERALAFRPAPVAPPPPPPPTPAFVLADVWDQAIAQIELPSTRMLLRQQVRLTALSPVGPELHAVLMAPEQWVPLTRTRLPLVADALRRVTGRPCYVDLREAPPQPPPPPQPQRQPPQPRPHRPKQTSYLDRLQPLPADLAADHAQGQRLTLRQWRRELQGRATEGNVIVRLIERLSPSSVAAAFRRLYQREPLRHGPVAAYTAAELVTISDNTAGPDLEAAASSLARAFEGDVIDPENNP